MGNTEKKGYTISLRRQGKTVIEDLYSENGDTVEQGGFVPRDLIRFFIVDGILIAATRLMLGLELITHPDAHVAILLAGKLILLFYIFWLIRGKRNAWSQTGAATAGKLYFWPVCVLLYACAYFLLGPINHVNHVLMRHIHDWLGLAYHPQPQDVMVLIFEDILTSPIRIALIVFVVLVGPVMEEFAFRGIGLDAYRRSAGTVYALGLTSLLFGLYHFTLHLVIPLGFLGLIFGLSRVMTRSLWCAIFIHCLHNGLTLALLASELALLK